MTIVLSDEAARQALKVLVAQRRQAFGRDPDGTVQFRSHYTRAINELCAALGIEAPAAPHARRTLRPPFVAISPHGEA